MAPLEQRMLPRTKDVMYAEIQRLTEKQIQTGQELRDLRAQLDGDMMDEPQLHRLHSQLEQIDAALRNLQMLIHSETIETPGERVVQVSIGHEVRVKIEYEDGDSEEMTMTIGTTLDVQYLGAVGADSFNNGQMLVSEVSPLGCAILGSKVGDIVKYQSNGTHRIIIESVRVSNLSHDTWKMPLE